MADIEIDSDVNWKAAIMAGGSSEMDAVADTIEMRVKLEAAKHRLTGSYLASIRTVSAMGVSGRGRQVQDRVVYTTDPNALSIEYGHMTGKRPHKPEDKFVPGLKIFQKAANASGR